MGKQNLIKIERKLKKIVRPTVFKLYILQIPIWSFKAKKYAQICYVGTFKSFGTFKTVENSIYGQNT